LLSIHNLLIYVGCGILILEVLDLCFVSIFSAVDFMLIILTNLYSEFKSLSISVVLLYSISFIFHPSVFCHLSLKSHFSMCGFGFVFSLIDHHLLLKYW
jgi:hypothetical protein